MKEGDFVTIARIIGREFEKDKVRDEVAFKFALYFNIEKGEGNTDFQTFDGASFFHLVRMFRTIEENS